MASHFPDPVPWATSPQPPATVSPESAPVPPKRSNRSWIGAALAGLLLFGAKAKWLIALATKAKFLTPLLSAFASVGAYALFWGWQFAVGFVVLLFVHEYGHAVELKRQGVPTGPITFLPFLGALITMKRMPKDVWHEARVAFGGPLIGSLGALVVLIAAVAFDSDLLRALAYTGFLLNLFNLIPLSPLDGGRIVSAIHKGAWIVGAVLALVALVVFHIWIMLLILLVAGFEMYRWWKGRGTLEAAAYHRISTERRIIAAAAYVALAVALVIGMAVSEIPRPE